MNKRSSKSKSDHGKKVSDDLDIELDPSDRMKKKEYEKELEKLQIELVKAQEWVKQKGTRLVVLFEGRDGAGKGSTIKRIVERLNPRGCRVVALSKPSDVEQTQWYFQRYVAHLPSAGEIVLMDRSWYNRAGVERVMGFCTNDQYQEFLRSAPEFERMLMRSGVNLIKYWFNVSYAEQGRRFQKRLDQPDKRWKFSPMDIEARKRWYEYSKARDAMMAATDIPEAPWYVVPSDDKRRAHLNCISHLLSLSDYQDIPRKKVKLPKRDDEHPYENSLRGERRFIPQPY